MIQIRAEQYFGTKEHPLPIGKQFEKNVRTIVFTELPILRETYGTMGSWCIVFQRPGEDLPYYVSDQWESTEGYACWDVSAEDSSISGLGKVELRFYANPNSSLYKTKLYYTWMDESLSLTVGELPIPYEDILERMIHSQGQMADYVTPEYYGAVGDGVHDDGPSIKAAIETGKVVRLTKDLYVFTPIVTVGTNVFIEGNDCTIHVDLEGESIGWGNPFSLCFKSKQRDDENGNLKLIYTYDRYSLKEIWGLDEGPGFDSYRLGYVSYNGCIPLPQRLLDKMEELGNIVTESYDANTFRVRNLTLRFKNCTGKYGLRFYAMVDGLVENVKSICEEGYDGMVGIMVPDGANNVIKDCLCQNWCHRLAYDIMGTNGYGLAPEGDNTRVYNYTGINNRDHIAGGGGNSKVWCTRLVVDGANLYTDCSVNNICPGSTGHGTKVAYEDGFECHGDAIHPIFTNINYTRINDDDNRSKYWAACEIRTISFTVSNVYFSGNGIFWFPAELVENMYLNNIVAPKAMLRFYHGENWELSTKGRHLCIENSEFMIVENFLSPVILKLVNCIIHDRIIDISHLIMVNTTVLGETDWAILSPIQVKDDALISNCDLYHNASKMTAPEVPLIDAPENSIQLINSRCRMMPGCSIFTNTQMSMNNSTQHRYGLILNHDTESLLDEYHPF